MLSHIGTIIRAISLPAEGEKRPGIVRRPRPRARQLPPPGSRTACEGHPLGWSRAPARSPDRVCVNVAVPGRGGSSSSGRSRARTNKVTSAGYWLLSCGANPPLAGGRMASALSEVIARKKRRQLALQARIMYQRSTPRVRLSRGPPTLASRASASLMSLRPRPGVRLDGRKRC